MADPGYMLSKKAVARVADAVRVVERQRVAHALRRRPLLNTGDGFFPVALVVTAGQVIGTHGGNQTTAPTWTYTVNDYYTGDELATEQSPATGRRFGRFNSATLGDGYVKTDGTIGLWRADEGPGTTSC